MHICSRDVSVFNKYKIISFTPLYVERKRIYLYIFIKKEYNEDENH